MPSIEVCFLKIFYFIAPQDTLFKLTAAGSNRPHHCQNLKKHRIIPAQIIFRPGKKSCPLVQIRLQFLHQNFSLAVFLLFPNQQGKNTFNRILNQGIPRCIVLLRDLLQIFQGLS